MYQIVTWSDIVKTIRAFAIPQYLVNFLYLPIIDWRETLKWLTDKKTEGDVKKSLKNTEKTEAQKQDFLEDPS